MDATNVFRMRPAASQTILSALALCAALFGATCALGALCMRDAEARPPPRRRALAAPAPPSSGASTSDRSATLRAPSSPAVLIRSGAFMMGSSDAEINRALALCKEDPSREPCPNDLFSDEFAPHEVYLSEYWIDRTEVTVARYRQCVAAGRCSEPPYASGAARFDRPEFPVVMVTWVDASSFCAWAGGRLPTEAEWERAARGMTGRRYPWGQVYSPSLANHGRNLTFGTFAGFVWSELDASDGYGELAPVGSFPDGRTADGIDDLAGNVEEWVSDIYAPEYPRATALNPTGPSAGEERVLRGGAYIHGHLILRAAARGHDLSMMRRPWRGFRCVTPGETRD